MHARLFLVVAASDNDLGASSPSASAVRVRGGGLDSASQQVSSLYERELVACADADGDGGGEGTVAQSGA